MRRTLGPCFKLGTKLDVTDVFKANAGDDLRHKSCQARPYYREENKPRVAGGQMTKFSRLVPNICGPSIRNLLHVAPFGTQNFEICYGGRARI